MRRILLVLICTLLTAGALTAQVRKALRLYDEGRYAEAIPLFEEAIGKQEKSSYLFKLADCYRRTNRPARAAALYEKIVSKKHYAKKAMYYYGEVLMSLGRYEEAKKWFLDYAAQAPNPGPARQKAAACDYVKTIRPYFDGAVAQSLPINSPGDDNSAWVFRDVLYFASDRKTGYNPLKFKADWTGRDLTRIYEVEIVDTSFGRVRPLPSRINNLNKNVSSPAFARGGVFFFSRNGTEVARDGTYKLQIYSARLLPGGRWTKPRRLSFCKKDINYFHPAVSSTGDSLFFVSDRSDGVGGTDIYVTYRNGDGWTIPQNLGEVVNTAEHEAFPFYDTSGRLFFSSKGHPGFGGFDIFMTQQDTTGRWMKPVNVGPPVNSGRDDLSFFMEAAGGRAFFASNRGGDNDDLYQLLLARPAVPEQPVAITPDSTGAALDHETVPDQITEGLTEEASGAAADRVAKPITGISDTGRVVPDPDYPTGGKAEEASGVAAVPAVVDSVRVPASWLLQAGDTIELIAPAYGPDQFDVPDFLAGQLDFLIVPMQQSPGLYYEICVPSGRPAEAFREETLAYSRAKAVSAYLAAKGVDAAHLAICDDTKRSQYAGQEKKLFIFVRSLE